MCDKHEADPSVLLWLWISCVNPHLVSQAVDYVDTGSSEYLFCSYLLISSVDTENSGKMNLCGNQLDVEDCSQVGWDDEEDDCAYRKCLK